MTGKSETNNVNPDREEVADRLDSTTDAQLEDINLTATENSTKKPGILSRIKQIPAKRWVIGSIVSVALIVGVIFLSTFLASLRSVPDLSGMTQSEAEDLIEELDLVAKPTMTAIAQRLPADLNVVVAQELEPGRNVRDGDVVRFDVEPQAFTMPDFTGMTWEQFSSRNKTLHYELTKGSEKAKRLHVISEQIPAPGTKSTYGAEMSLVFSIPQAEVPNLIGLDVVTAQQTLVRLGLEVKVDKKVNAVVKSQSIAPGEMVDVHTVVEIENGFLVPDVVGKTIQEANDILRQAGFLANPHDGSQNLPIFTQNPAAGSVVGRDEPILTYSPKHTKVFRVESNGSYGSVTWGMSSISQDTNASFPWEHVIESDNSLDSKINLIAQAMDGDSITCKLIVDGKVVFEQTSTGPYAVVSCAKF